MGFLILLLFGFAFGFLGSLPVAGPIALLVVTLVLDGAHRRAVLVSAGAAVAEGGYAALAFWGFSSFLADYGFVVPLSRGIAAAILTGIAIALIRRKPATAPPLKKSWAGGGALLGFGITALNPTLIGTWSAAVSTLFATNAVAFSPGASLPFGLSVAAGIFAWFALFIHLGRRHTGRFRRETLNRVVRVMGFFALAVALGFAVWCAAWFF